MTCCFIGHRKIKDTPELRERLRKILTELIEGGTVNFIFGDHSEINSLCYELTTELKQTHPAIRRIKFRKDHGEADDYTMQFLREGYEESICPQGVENAGRASYVARNQAMIRESDICIFYYDESYLPPKRKQTKNQLSADQPKSGTALAYSYAESKKKTVINCFSAGV